MRMQNSVGTGSPTSIEYRLPSPFLALENRLPWHRAGAPVNPPAHRGVPKAKTKTQKTDNFEEHNSEEPLPFQNLLERVFDK